MLQKRAEKRRRATPAMPDLALDRDGSLGFNELGDSGGDLPLDDPGPSRKRRRAYVEEEPDQDAVPGHRFSDKHPTAGKVLGKGETAWEARRAEDLREGYEPWEPFKSADDWKLGEWLMTCGISQREMDRHLSLPSVCLSFTFPFLKCTHTLQPSRR